MSTTPAPIRSLAAECRGVEEGHHARVAGNKVLVKSDTEPGLTWQVRFTVTGTDLFMTCEGDRPNSGHDRLMGDAGMCPCKHSAVAVRRLEREGLARWNAGVWEPTAAGQVFASTAHLLPADPFHGLGGQ